MTCQKSLINTAKSMFIYKFKGTIIISVLQFILLFLLLPYGLISAINAVNSNIILSNGNEKITDLYKYMLSEDMTTMAYLVVFIIIVAGIALGIKQFKFFADKKTVNVFYSLGITRTKMYLSTYFSGAIAQILSVGLPMVIAYLISIRTFGLSKELTTAFLLIFFSLITVSLLVYTLTAVVFSMVGSLIEGIFYACFTIGFPTGILFCFGLMTDKMLFGSTLFKAAEGGYYSSIDAVITSVIEGKYSILSPVLFPIRNIIHYGKFTLNTDFDMNAMSTWTTPHYVSLIVWAILCIVFAIIGLVVFNRRKAEICGFVGVNKFLNFVLFSTIGVISMAFISLFKLTVFLTIIVGIIVAVIMTTIIILIFSKISKLKFMREFIKIPLYLLAGVITVIILTTGLFGYSSKIPKSSEIKSISINTITSDISPDRVGGYMSYSLPSSDFYGAIYGSISSADLIDITDVNDMEMVKDIHQKIIDIGKIEPKRSDENFEKTIFSTDLKIKYTLKNGDVIERNYTAASKQLIEEMLKINDTNTYKKRFIDVLNNAYDNVKLFSNDLLTDYKLALSEVEFLKLKENLIIDYQKLSALELAHPTGKSFGVIQLYNDSPEYKDPYNTQIFGSDYYGSVSIFLTEKMTNTLNYLKELGYDQYLTIDENLNVVSATLISTNESEFSYMYCSDYNNISLSFSGSSYSKNPNEEQYKNDFSSDNEKSDTTIKDESMIEYLRNNAYGSYFTSKSGYFVLFETEDGSKTCMFIPTDKLPENIISTINKK